MPLIEGEALRARLARERELPVRDALRILRDVADPLAYAHGRGLVHRDIKPDNVLLSGGHALVADFGIAKALSESSGSSGRGIADLVMWCLEKNPADRPQTAAELVPALEGMPTPTGGTTTVRNAWPAPGGARLPRAARGLVAPSPPVRCCPHPCARPTARAAGAAGGGRGGFQLCRGRLGPSGLSVAALRHGSARRVEPAGRRTEALTLARTRAGAGSRSSPGHSPTGRTAGRARQSSAECRRRSIWRRCASNRCSPSPHPP